MSREPSDSDSVSADDASATAPDDDTAAARDVVVPIRVYKTVTVFSTLIAVVSVLGGFVIIDAATNRGRLPASEIDVPLALLGVGLILFGSVVYAFSTRFRTEGMGNAKDDADEASDNG
ncbi:MAG: hypothetical protein ABEH35_01255 [Haloarculaceae archaeon]